MRSPFKSDHSFARQGGKFHLLIGITGSVASIKLADIINELIKLSPPDKLVSYTSFGLVYSPTMAQTTPNSELPR